MAITQSSGPTVVELVRVLVALIKKVESISPHAGTEDYRGVLEKFLADHEKEK